MLRGFLAFLALTAAAHAGPKPFWQAKDKVYERVKSGEIIVAVTSASPEAPLKNRLTINGGGWVRAPRDFVFEYAQDFDKLARLSGFIEKSAYDKDGGNIRLTVSALGYKAELKAKVASVRDADPKRIEFEVVEGVVKGMRNQILFVNPESPGKTEVAIQGEYRYDTFPIPKAFLEFGMEVVFQKMAARLRQQVETAYRGVEKK